MSSYVSLSRGGYSGRVKPSAFRFIFISSLISISSNAQITALQVLEKSEKFYRSHSNGHIVMTTIFKSAIAEAIMEDKLTIDFCRQKKIILVKNKPVNRSFITNLKEYPFYYPGIFQSLKKRKWNLNRSSGRYELQDRGTQYHFDTLTFQVINFKELTFSSYGLQVKEWKVISQEYTRDCTDSLRFIKNVPTKIIEPVNTDWTGKNISALLPDTIRSYFNSNKYLLLDFFTQSCMPCIASFPDLKKLHSEIQELIIIGLDPNPADSSTMEKFIRRYKLEYPVLSGQTAIKFNELINPANIVPFYLLVDSTGIVLELQEGQNENFFDRVKKRIITQLQHD